MLLLGFLTEGLAILATKMHPYAGAGMVNSRFKVCDIIGSLQKQ